MAREEATRSASPLVAWLKPTLHGGRGEKSPKHQRMSGKIIVTNTTTARNVEELQKRGLHILVTTTPRLEERSFGTNVLEAMLRCLVDKADDQITAEDFLDLIERIPLEPQIKVLN